MGVLERSGTKAAGAPLKASKAKALEGLGKGFRERGGEKVLLSVLWIDEAPKPQKPQLESPQLLNPKSW